MYSLRKSSFINKALFASVAGLSTSTIKAPPAFCAEQTWSSNGYRLPKFGTITPPLLEKSVNNELAKFDANLISLNIEIERTCRDHPTAVVDALEMIGMPLHKEWGLVSHLNGVRSNEEIRAVQKTLQEKVVKANQELGQSRSVYDGLAYLRDNKAVWWDVLDEPQRRIISSKLLDMEHSGVALSPGDRERFSALQLEAAKLSSTFKNNVLDTTKMFTHVVSDPKDMAGVPEGSKAMFSGRAVAAGFKDSTAATGPWVITLDIPSYLACMQHVQNSSIREAVYRAYLSRASEFSPAKPASAETVSEDPLDNSYNNTPIIERLLEIRYDMARMLGYKNYAEKSLATKMAGSIPVVMDMYKELLQASLSAAKSDLAEVETFAIDKCGFKPKSDERISTGGKCALELWDIPFYTERLREAKYGFKEEELKVYFALNNVLTGLFSLAEKLFGVQIESIPTIYTEPSASEDCSDKTGDGAVEVWHKDVLFFTIKDSKSKTLLASFYLDPYSRPEDKNGGAWMAGCKQKSKLFNQIPTAYLICNGSPPVGDKPALMTFREVETLFHEFGHGLQHMLTKVTQGEASGIANIEWDAVELPSQFMENWCYDTDTLMKFARHFETNEPIPAFYMDKLKASKNFQSGAQMLRQLYFGVMDMTLHSTVPGEKTGWVYDIQADIASKYAVVAPLSDDRFLNGFAHIFAGGYSAGYYSYKWAEVMSADAFAAFEEVGLSNSEAVEKLGRKFRDTVLASGGGLHPSEVYKNFRGRAPNTAALLRHSGLTDKSESDNTKTAQKDRL